MENQQERLQKLEKQQDWPGLAKAYYELGCQAMDQGRLEQAALWLHRADPVYSAQDETYEAVDDQRRCFITRVQNELNKPPKRWTICLCGCGGFFPSPAWSL